MSNIKKIELNEEQRSELEKGYRFGSSHRFRMRCRGVLLKAQGLSSPEISKIVGYGHIPVLNWVRRYEKDGIAGLREKGGRGPKPLMDASDSEAVRTAVRKHRLSVKTAKAAWEQASRKAVSDSTFKRFLKVLAQDISV